VNPECRLLPLDSFVHAPLARLLKYPLLLDVRAHTRPLVPGLLLICSPGLARNRMPQAVIKYTPSDHPDREPLVKVRPFDSKYSWRSPSLQANTLPRACTGYRCTIT
jgi:hypothetical protein